MKKSIFPSQLKNTIAPHSPALQVDNTIYVSGQIPMTFETGALVKGDMKEQTFLAMSNMKTVIEMTGE